MRGSDRSYGIISPVSLDYQDQVHRLPEVVRGVSVGDQENSDGGVVLDRIDAVTAAGVVFTGVSPERLE